jgi:surface polysaccharide O-acyltransferase-like enzyme
MPDLNANQDEEGERAQANIASRWRSVLRLIAMQAVIAIHVSGFNAAQPSARESWGGRLAILINSGALFSVPIFVMVSGSLLLDPSRHQSNQYFRKRAGRLVPPLVFWHVTYFFFIRTFLEVEISPLEAIERALYGELYTALYFFWIALGLSFVAPLIVPFIVARRNVSLIAAFAASGPILMVVGNAFWPDRPGWTHTAWTWWYFYLGYFMLGWILSHVKISRRTLALASCAMPAVWILLYTAWLNEDAPLVAKALYPASYYSLGVHVFAVLVFVVVRGLVEQTSRKSATVHNDRGLRLLADATLGVFAMHLITIEIVFAMPGLGGDSIASSAAQLVARIAAVTVLTFTVVVALRRLPMLRQVL